MNVQTLFVILAVLARPDLQLDASAAEIRATEPVRQTLAEGVRPKIAYDRYDLILHLRSTQSGRGLLLKASQRLSLSETKLAGLIEWGEVSRTDAVVTRHIDPLTGKELRSREITIFLKPINDLNTLTLDFAHELTHAALSESWDPYSPTLKATNYVQNGIEGPGGEVEAILNECQVAEELHSLDERCERYQKLSNISERRHKITQEFYRVGKQGFVELQKLLGSEMRLLPKLSSEEPELISSTGQAPYPLSLYREFIDLSHVACENTAKRRDAIAAIKSLPERGPASELSQLQAKKDELFYQRRCKK